MLRPKSAQVAFIIPLLLASATAFFPQRKTDAQQTSQNSGGITLEITSRLTLVDVTATDSNGRPVRGLKESDFSIKQDGKPQVIKSFDEYGADRLSAQAALPQLPPNIYTNAQPPAPTTSAVNVLMFDDVTGGGSLNSHGTMLAYARLQALKYLKTMPTGTRIAILELADQLRVVQNFTSDRAVLLAAVGSISFKPVGEAIPPSPPPRRPMQEVCNALNTQSELALDALEGAAAFLAGVQGRKNLIWFTPGIPWLTNSIGIGCFRDYSHELQRAYGLLAAAHVALYPINPQGVGGGIGPSRKDLANATGGEAYNNSNDLDEEIGEAIASGSDYYSLSYVPPRQKYDGLYHRIEVKVDRPSLHLVYRRGYTAIDLAQIPKPIEKKSSPSVPVPDSELHAAMGHGAAPATEVLFDVRVSRATDPAELSNPQVMGNLSPALKGKHLVKYDVQYVFPPGQITLEDEVNGKRKGSVHFVIVAYNGQGKTLNTLTTNTTFTVMEDNVSHFLHAPFLFPFHLEFDLPPGQSFVRLGVLDVPSQRVGTLEIPVTVTK
jgi:VWFA-related protein